MPVKSLSDSNPASKDPRTPQEKRAHRLAQTHTQVNDKKGRKRPCLLKHLPGMERTLREGYHYFKTVRVKDVTHARASEWMLDNFYIIEQTLHQIEEDLPKEFLNQLPKLAKTRLAGYPRVYALAIELVEPGHGAIDLDQVVTYVNDYQKTVPLMIGELWALPIMLRIGILYQLTKA
ncbi:MAG: hypothetical protein JW704_04175, partial [Anaerolineaceae bacterium]|nr:hypothetical protein [Anaerolineaceae bacterium]